MLMSNFFILLLTLKKESTKYTIKYRINVNQIVSIYFKFKFNKFTKNYKINYNYIK